MRKIQMISFAAAAALAASSFATFSSSTGFETAGVPPYVVTQPLNGQNGWDVMSGNVATLGATVSTTVQATNNGPSAIGTNSVVFNNGAVPSFTDSQSFTTAAPTSSAPLINNTNPASPIGFTNSLFTVRADLRVDDGATPATTASDFYALEVYDNNGRIAGVQRALDNTASAKLYVTDATGNYNVLAPVANGPASGVYGTYSISVNYNTGFFNVNFNGASIGTFPLTTGYGFQADPLIFNSGRGADVAYLDNFSVTAVPEPTTGVALALGGLAMLARRRRSN